MIKRNKKYPFSVICPICNGDTDGLVDDYLCMKKSNYNEDSKIRIVSHECFTCGEIIGLIVELAEGKIKVLKAEKYEQQIKGTKLV